MARPRSTRPAQGARPGGHSPGRRTRPATEWLTGRHAVREALFAARRRFERLWLRPGEEQQRPELAEIAGRARALGIPVEEVETDRWAELGEPEANPQGVALRAGPLPEVRLSELLKTIAASPTPAAPHLLALDGVEDPQNVGALARVAEAAGVVGMILTTRRAPPLSAAVARASAGAIEWLPVARVPNLARALDELAAAGFWSVAAAPEAEQGLYAVPDRILSGPLVVVLGAEGRGVRPAILERADHLVGIPMRGRIASLNVSTAGAVVLYELLRRAEAGAAEVGPPPR